MNIKLKLFRCENKIKDMFKERIVFINDNKNLSNIKVRDGMEIHILKVVDNIEVLEIII